MSKITGTAKKKIVWQCPTCNICTMAHSQDEAIDNIEHYWSLMTGAKPRCGHFNTKPRKPALRIDI
jgi:hypothetical protein